MLIDENIGALVECLHHGPHNFSALRPGSIGILRSRRDAWWCIDWADEVSDGDCDGLCAPKHGAWIHHEHIGIVQEPYQNRCKDLRRVAVRVCNEVQARSVMQYAADCGKSSAQLDISLRECGAHGLNYIALGTGEPNELCGWTYPPPGRDIIRYSDWVNVLSDTPAKPVVWRGELRTCGDCCFASLVYSCPHCNYRISQRELWSRTQEGVYECRLCRKPCLCDA